MSKLNLLNLSNCKSNFWFNFKLIIVMSLLATFSTSAFAFQSNAGKDHPGQIQDDSALVQALSAKHNEFYIEAGNLVVTKVLPDDTKGLPHQKWEAQLSNGSTVTIVYNSDMGARVPVQPGEHFGVGGQLIITGNTGLIHWLHDDPKGLRPDGYVYLNGVIYGDTDHEDVPKEIQY